MQISIIKSIHETEKNAWNKFEGGPYYSYEWFSYIEENFGKEFIISYLLCTEKGKLVGALPVFRPLLKHNAYFNVIFGNYKWLNKLPLLESKPLICFSPYTFKSTILTEKRIQKEVGKKLLEAAQDIMKKEKLTEIVFFNISEREISLVNLLQEANYQRMFHIKSTLIKNKWNTFDEYVSSLKKRSRKTIRNDINRFEGSGAKTKILTNYKKRLPELAKLCQEVLDKHESTMYKFSEKILSSFYNHMKPYMSIFVCEHKGKYIATITNLEKDKLVSNHALGLNYIQTRENRAYYNTIYYQQIRNMIKKGIPEADFGTEAFRTKEIRGCTLVNRYMFIKQRKNNPIKNMWFRLLDKHYKRKFIKHYKRGRG